MTFPMNLAAEESADEATHFYSPLHAIVTEIDGTYYAVNRSLETVQFGLNGDDDYTRTVTPPIPMSGSTDASDSDNVKGESFSEESENIWEYEL